MNSRKLHASAFLILIAGVAGMSLVAGCGAPEKAGKTEGKTPTPKATEKIAIQAPATLGNLLAAYKLEVAAKARYDAFAIKADAEGYTGVAALFRATAVSQDVLIKKRIDLVKKLSGQEPPGIRIEPPAVQSTKENLALAAAAAIGGKNLLYPDFAKQAEVEKNTPAVYAFKGAMAAETEYVKYFQQALADLNGWKAEGKTFAVCEVCSFLVMGAPPAACPICAAPREKFRIVK